MEKKNNDGPKTAKRPKSEAVSMKYVTEFAELAWYEPNLERSYSCRVAEFFWQMAVKMPFYVASASMAARAVEGLRTQPSDTSLVVRRLKNALPQARKILEKMDGSRFLVTVRHLGYRATVDDLDKANSVSDMAVRKAAAAASQNANVHARIVQGNIPDTPENEEIKDRIRQRQRDSVMMDKIGKGMLTKLLEALSKKKIN